MKFFFVLLFVVVLVVVSMYVVVDIVFGSDVQVLCVIVYVIGVGGLLCGLSEYFVSLLFYNYLKDNDFQCKVGDDECMLNCIGVIYLCNEQVSVYDDFDLVMLIVVVCVEFDYGQKYLVIIVVQCKNVCCK